MQNIEYVISVFLGINCTLEIATTLSRNCLKGHKKDKKDVQ